MSKTVHSVKLQAYDSVDLDKLSYSNGDLVYDLTNSTIRLMDGLSTENVNFRGVSQNIDEERMKIAKRIAEINGDKT